MLSLMVTQCIPCTSSSLPPDVVIGFEMEEYAVFESDGVVTLVVSVMEGDIRTSITVALSTMNGSALGRFSDHKSRWCSQSKTGVQIDYKNMQLSTNRFKIEFQASVAVATTTPCNALYQLLATM